MSIILLLNYTKGLLFWLTYEETIGKASSAHTRVAVKRCRIFTCQMHTLLPEWITSSLELNPKTRITLADVGRWFNQLLRDHEARNNHDYLLHTSLWMKWFIVWNLCMVLQIIVEILSGLIDLLSKVITHLVYYLMYIPSCIKHQH